MRVRKKRRAGHGNGRMSLRILPALFLTACAGLIISGLLCEERAGAQTQGCVISLSPSAPSVDNGIPDVYGYYNLESSVSVSISVRAETQGPGIREISYWITDGTEASSPVETQLLYEDTYVEPKEPEEPGEPGEPEEPEEPEEPKEPEEPEEPEEPGEPDEPEEPGEPEEPEESGEPEEPKESDEDIPSGEEGETHRALELWEGSVDVDTARWHTGDVQVHVRAVDFAGIERENSVRLDIDAERPKVSLSYDNNGSSGMDSAGNACFNAAPGGGSDGGGAVRTATVVITERSDHFSGEKAVNGIRVTAADADDMSSAAAPKVRITSWVTKRGTKPDEDTHTATIEFLGDALYSLEISYTDEAGNENEGVETGDAVAPWQFVIDTTEPVISVSYDNNTPFTTACFGSARTATIRIRELNFDPDLVSLVVTNPGGSVPAIGEWSSGRTVTDAARAEPVYTATLIFDEDGDYSFDIICTDLAGNRSDGVRFAEGTVDGSSFVVDRTAPIVTVSYDNNRVSEEKYFNSPRAATVVITERNFDKDLVSFSRTAETDGNDDVAAPVTWSHEGDVHSAIVLFAADGDYTFDVSVTDLAGNDSGEADFGESAAARAFTIDCSPPQTWISGVTDGQSCSKTAAPAVRIYDRNFCDYDISLTRTRLDEIDADVTDRFFGERELSARGGELLCRNPEKTRDNDGIYTLRVGASDLAGNESEASVTFSVNRFGSIYVFGDYLISLIRDGGSYVQAVEDDLVITEYNPARLAEESFFLDITRDGKPMTDVNCRMSFAPGAAVPVGKRGWYEYRYTIGRDNFSPDGVYKVSISSKDEAGNISYNAREAGMDILFRVDATAPEISGSARTDENGILKQGDNFEFTAYDTIGLKSLMIYLNGEIVGEPITDFGNDINRFSGTIAVEPSASEQEVRLVATDLAGNSAETYCSVPAGVRTFAELMDFPRAALEEMSKRNTFFPVIAGAAAAAAAILVLLFVKRRSDGEG